MNIKPCSNLSKGGEKGERVLRKKKMKFSSPMEAVAKSYMRKGFQIYEEMLKY